MSNPNDISPLSCRAFQQDDPQAQIEDYLDYLCAPLLGIVPYAQRRRLRLETEDHLLALTEDFQSEGFAPEDAISRRLSYGSISGAGGGYSRRRTLTRIDVPHGKFTQMNPGPRNSGNDLSLRNDLFAP